MCFRINNLHNLNIALEDVQQKIAALLKMGIITVEESEKSKEHSKGKRNGIFFSWTLSLFFVSIILVSGMQP